MSVEKLIILILTSFLATAHTLECYSCDSAEDTECATKPGQQISVEECSKVDDECVTAIVAGITRRGCMSRLYPNNYCAEPCQRCSTSLCNRNVFPENRLRCYQCVGSDCIDVNNNTKSSLLLPCPVYDANDRCYTNVIGENNVQRGCEKTNLPTTCPNVCLKCNYDGCNNELGVTQQSCLECSHTRSSPNYDCWRNQNMNTDESNCKIEGLTYCQNKMMYGHKGQCFTYINEQTETVQRGCSTTMGFYPTGQINYCYGENCNNECLTISCNTCNSTLDSNCRRGINLRSQKCESDTFSCFSCEQGSQLRRGCSDKATFLQADEEACYKCRDANGCNNMSVRTCYHCSSLENSDCSNWSNASSIAQQNCSSPDELCVSTMVTKFNLVYAVRGCASQVGECTQNDPFCIRCNGSLCNNQPVTLSSRLGIESKSQNHLITLKNSAISIGCGVKWMALPFAIALLFK